MDNEKMPDSTDNIPINDESSNANDNKASHDLSSAVEEAMRLLKKAQGLDSSNNADINNVEAVDEENGETTNDLQQEAFKAMKLQAELKRDAEQKARATVEVRSVFTDTMRLKLESSESGDPIIKSVIEELVVGRADNVTDYVPDVDLTPHGAYRLGLSRRHAIILREGDRLLVKDLNSRNGTFVNGGIVAGGGTQMIRDGDELRFGNLAMRVSFES